MSASVGPSAIFDDSLVLHLDAANSRSYPGTGTTWYDLSSQKNHAITTTIPAFINGTNNQPCFSYTKANSEYFITTSNTPFSGSNFAITVSAVVRETSTNIYSGIVTQHDNSTVNCMSFLSLSGKFGTDHWQPGGRQLQTLPTLGQLCYVTWVESNWTTQKTTGQIYLNGILQTTVEYGAGTTSGLTSNKFTIGNWYLPRTDMDFGGEIYAVHVYNRALTAAEVRQNFISTKSRFNL